MISRNAGSWRGLPLPSWPPWSPNQLAPRPTTATVAVVLATLNTSGRTGRPDRISSASIASPARLPASAGGRSKAAAICGTVAIDTTYVRSVVVFTGTGTAADSVTNITANKQAAPHHAHSNGGCGATSARAVVAAA